MEGLQKELDQMIKLDKVICLQANLGERPYFIIVNYYSRMMWIFFLLKNVEPLGRFKELDQMIR